MMTLSYLYSKFFKKIIRGKCILNSKIHKTSVVYSGSSVVNSTIGRYSYVSYDCSINNCDIGQFCSLASNIVIGAAEHPISWVSTSPVFQDVKHSGPVKRFAKETLPSSKRTNIGNDVWIGTNVIIKQGVVVGDGAVIGSGAVVTKDVPPYAIVVEAPARVVKYRFDEKTIQKLLEIKWWNMTNSELTQFAKFVKNPDDFIKEVQK
mgnify:CR=1 FL=1